MKRVQWPVRPEPVEGRALEHGMTLIEIMVVLVILGLIATAVAYNVVGAAGRARIDRAKNDVHMISSQGIDTFRVMKGRYPTTEEGIKILIDEKILKPNNEKGTITDPWGREYIYLCPGQKHPDSYDVKSYGADGQPGGDDENADIDNY